MSQFLLFITRNIVTYFIFVYTIILFILFHRLFDNIFFPSSAFFSPEHKTSTHSFLLPYHNTDLTNNNYYILHKVLTKLNKKKKNNKKMMEDKIKRGRAK